MKTVVVIPTYNEMDNLRPLVETILSRTPEWLEVVIVDDNSPDGTGRLADTLCEQSSRVHAIHREKKEGLGPAYRFGFHWAISKGYEAVIQMDADFSHNPIYLPEVLENLKDHDLVIGSRYVKGGGTLNWGLMRRLISRGGSLYSRLILGANIADFTGGFNAWRTSALQAIGYDACQSDGYSFQIELKYRAFRHGLRIKEFPIVFEDRKVGNSKMSRKIVLEALWRVYRFRSGSSSERSEKLQHKNV